MDELIRLLQRAAAALKVGRHAEAEALARAALARDPACGPAYTALAHANLTTRS